MRRALLLLLLAAALGPAAASAQDPAAKPALSAALTACGTGATPGERFALFTGSMPARPGTRRMWMRFDLFERSGPAARWARVPAPSFGRWERSQPRRAGFVYTKRVERLRDAAAYRAVVRFRWFDARGAVQRTTRRTTPVCVQPDRRPDLQVVSIGVVPGAAEGSAIHLVTVANGGLTAAAPFDVGIVAGGEDRVSRVAGLAAGERTTIEVPGRRCRGAEQVSATADVRGEVDEADERDNALSRACDAR
jgi:hypothetical protein